jgi:hypothetical protein
MSRLLHDRYYTYGPAQAWDLATGDSVRVDEIVAETNEPPAPASLLEVRIPRQVRDRSLLRVVRLRPHVRAGTSRSRPTSISGFAR